LDGGGTRILLEVVETLIKVEDSGARIVSRVVWTRLGSELALSSVVAVTVTVTKDGGITRKLLVLVMLMISD